MSEPELDPRNLSFAWPQRQGPYRIISEDQAKQWNEQGFFLLKNVISETAIRDLTEAIDPLEAKAEAFLRKQEHQRFGISRADEITFTVHLCKRVPEIKAFVLSSLFADLCLDLLGDSARLYWDQAVYKKPETPAEFPWHQDNGYNFVHPQDYLTCWIPLVDTNSDNGCPWVVPGIHQLGTLAHWETELGYQCLDEVNNAICVAAEAGDIVVFSSLTPHRTGPNLTDGIRKAYILQFSQDGSRMLPRDGGEPVPQDDPERQFLITRDGRQYSA